MRGVCGGRFGCTGRVAVQGRGSGWGQGGEIGREGAEFPRDRGGLRVWAAVVWTEIAYWVDGADGAGLGEVWEVGGKSCGASAEVGIFGGLAVRGGPELSILRS